MTNERKIIVAYLDPLMPMYQVVDENNHCIGEKTKTFGHLKPIYGKNGRLISKRCRFVDRKYITDPPWFKYEVICIDNLGGQVTLHTRKLICREVKE